MTNKKKRDSREHQMALLATALRDVLRAGGALNNDTSPSGPELLLAAQDFIEHARRPTPEDCSKGVDPALIERLEWEPCGQCEACTSDAAEVEASGVVSVTVADEPLPPRPDVDGAYKLAHDCVTMTLHGPLPLPTSMKLAEHILALHGWIAHLEQR